MQIIKYEIEKDILTVGFKVDNFVVYAQVAYDENKAKDELLQLAYIQAKPSIEYEKTLEEHSFITNKIGEVFIPELPRPTKLDVNFDTLSGRVLDQYSEVYSNDVEFYIEGDKVRIEDGMVIEDVVDEYTVYKIIAKYNDLIIKENRAIYPLTPNEIDILNNKITELEKVIDTILGVDDIE